MTEKGKHLTAADMRAQIPEDAAKRFFTGFERGTLSIELYVPKGEDLQQPHEQDECYIVNKGSGQFVMGDETVDFNPGDFLFVPASMEHRFINFGDECEVWVIFYGPKGGEKP